MQQAKARRVIGPPPLVPLETNVSIAEARRAACPAPQYTVSSSSENANPESELEG